MIQTQAAKRVVVIGGGLAGISAAVGLAEAGLPVTLLEARPWLGGATCSFARRGLTIDNGQHAFLRCFTAYRELLAKFGVCESCESQDRLNLSVLAPGARGRIYRSGLPAPLHLARSLAGYRMLSVAERAKVATAAVQLQFSDLSGGRARAASLGSWLSARGQTDHARRMFWDVLTVGLLNIAGDDADAELAASVIRTATLTARDAADIGVPAVPLSLLHAAPAADLLARLGAEVLVGVRAAAVQPGDWAGRYQVRLASAGPARQTADDNTPEVIDAAGIVLAVPPWEAAKLATASLGPSASSWAQLLPSPVVSIHVIYGSRVTALPFAAAVGSPIRWIMDKTQSAGLHAGQYLAATVPAARDYVDQPAAQLQDQLLPALEQLLPAAADADVEDFFVTRERRATIAQVAGSGRFRAGAGTGPAGFAVAGAWTGTGWPDTMEGAVRSGQAAARKVIAELTAARVVACPAAVAASTIVRDEPAAAAPDAEPAADREKMAGKDHEGNGAPYQDELPGIAELAAPPAAAADAGPPVSAAIGPVPAARR